MSGEELYNGEKDKKNMVSIIAKHMLLVGGAISLVGVLLGAGSMISAITCYGGESLIIPSTLCKVFDFGGLLLTSTTPLFVVGVLLLIASVGIYLVTFLNRKFGSRITVIAVVVLLVSLQLSAPGGLIGLVRPLIRTILGS